VKSCKRGKRIKETQEIVGHLHLLHALLGFAGHAGLGHVALEDALLDILGVVLLALLGVQAAEEDTFQVLVGFRAEEKDKCGDEDDAPFPVIVLADVYD